MAVKSETKESKWKVARVSCEGTARIMFHNPATRDDLKLKDASDEVVAEACLYKNEKDEIGLPADNLCACLRNAGTMVSITMNGKKIKITTGGRSKSKGSTQSTLLHGFLRIREPFIVLKGDDWVIDKRFTKNPTTGGMNSTVRARMNKWAFSATVEYDESLISGVEVQKLFETGGRWFGLGTFRGPFGSFRVVKYEKIS
jgi:hypothetical protein